MAAIRGSILGVVVLSTLLAGGIPTLLAGQDIVQTAAERVITISRGSTAILTRPD